MANVDIRVGKKNAVFFSANPTLVLKDGQLLFNSDTGELFIGNGVSQLSTLTPINGGSSYTLTASEIGSVINGATSATPNDTDLVMFVESSVAKKNTWAQIKDFIKTYFDSIYTTTSAVASQITSALSGYATELYVDTGLATKLASISNLSDLSNIFTAKNNLGLYSLFITTGNQTTTSNVAVSITGLSFSAEANKLYTIDGFIATSCNASGGVKFNVTIPAGATMYIRSIGAGTGSSTVAWNGFTTSGSLMPNVNNSQNATGMTHFMGHIQMGATTGDVIFGFASGINTQTSTIRQLGTNINIKKEN